MNKLMYRFVATTEKKKRNQPVFRHGMPLQGIPRKKIPDLNLDTACPAGIPRKKRNLPVFRHEMPFRASRVIRQNETVAK